MKLLFKLFIASVHHPYDLFRPVINPEICGNAISALSLAA